MTKARLLTLLAACLLPLLAFSQGTYPDKPIKLIVPFAPGGVTDTSGRLIAEALAKRLGQPVVVENKAGASGNIGTQGVINAAPDGYTLVLGFDGTMVINPHVFSPAPFDPLKDLAPVGKIGDAILILVAYPGVPYKTLQELIAFSKKEAKGVSYGTSGIGGTPHIAGELLNQQTGSNLVHVPYKGGGQAISDALGGNIPLVYTAVAGAHPVSYKHLTLPTTNC
jgi:tripartite-type tricarboxylate transporter receptor subunit TctC